MESPFHTLIGIFKRLDEVKIFYSILNARENAVMINATVPGQRWEIEVLDDGEIEIEVFTSDGTMYGKNKLEELFRDFSD